jgi:outer membrane protein assembly factor BamB
VGHGRAFIVTDLEALALDLRDGSVAWAVALEYPTRGPALLTAGGDVIISSRTVIIGLDAATGAERWRHEMAGRLSAAPLLTAAGDLVVGDDQGYVESFPVGSGPLASPWPQPWADERRTGRQRLP